METVSKTKLNQKCTLQFLSVASSGTEVVEHQKAQLEIRGRGGGDTGPEIYDTHTPTYVCLGHI